MKLSKQLTDEAILRELGSRLTAARLARNLTQAALAENAGISKRTLERLESGEVVARLSAFVRVLRALELIDRLDALMPAPAPGPVEQLKLAGRQRQRASRGRKAGTPAARKWKWGQGT
jgi:transcriptional regulator with XRE-family HTH domain